MSTNPQQPFSEAGWRKSSYSNGSGGECVEAAPLHGGAAVRDSKDPDGPVLRFSPDAWASFIRSVREGGLV
ncbi:DUF397 domain-containing protein [Streptomyces sp. H10-C2]|uniref:DUF397 domain-containing protein n=1 Tax=unclassified Streptomyces TaxID=2593676 RepID=UPI0024B8F5EB|nr:MULTISPECIES: DUF397 domain-containing protein [unclassified Streptomyces]MDJ0344959.1 DUF397 domain-containing protein [Streptomyces sp. PH10-H1]MDJ0373960.1 DUF397 domain-containing protein [Streptomyces sp. H10-C2]